MSPVEAELADSFERASREAQSAFGNGAMFVEKFVEVMRLTVLLSCPHGSMHAIDKLLLEYLGTATLDSK